MVSATPGATQEILLQLWLNGHFFCSLPLEFGSIKCLSMTEILVCEMELVWLKERAKWRCLANNNGCESRSRAEIRKAAAKSYEVFDIKE